MRQYKTFRRCLLIIAIVLAIAPTTANSACLFGSGSAFQQADTVSSANESKWRYTRFGWQRPADWLRTSSYVAPRIIDRIHPMVWAVNVLLAALGALIWASDEWQVARLLGHDKQKARRKSKYRYKFQEKARSIKR